MRVRPATNNDIPALQALAELLPTAAQWSTDQYRELFAGSPRTTLLIEDERAATVVGFVVARSSDPDWELENIAVAQSHQRRGLATLLLDALVNHAKSRGAHSILLEVRSSNEIAQCLYERNAFREIGRRRNYYVNPSEDALLYRRDLL